MITKEIKEKIKNKIHICSKCYEELKWEYEYCPRCGNCKYIPYFPNPASKISCINPTTY